MTTAALSTLRAAVFLVSLAHGFPVSPAGATLFTEGEHGFDGYAVFQDGQTYVLASVTPSTDAGSLAKAIGKQKYRSPSVVISGVISQLDPEQYSDFLATFISALQFKPPTLLIVEKPPFDFQPLQSALTESQVSRGWRFMAHGPNGQSDDMRPVFVGTFKKQTLVVSLHNGKIGSMPAMQSHGDYFSAPMPEQFAHWFQPPSQYSYVSVSAPVKVGQRVVYDNLVIREKLSATTQQPVLPSGVRDKMVTALMTSNLYRFSTDNGKNVLPKEEFNFSIRRGDMFKSADIILYDGNVQDDRRLFATFLSKNFGGLEIPSLGSFFVKTRERGNKLQYLFCYGARLTQNFRANLSSFVQFLDKARAEAGKTTAKVIAMPRLLPEYDVATIQQRVFMAFHGIKGIQIQWYESVRKASTMPTELSVFNESLVAAPSEHLSVEEQSPSVTEDPTEQSASGGPSAAPPTAKPPRKPKGKKPKSRNGTQSTEETVDQPSEHTGSTSVTTSRPQSTSGTASARQGSSSVTDADLKRDEFAADLAKGLSELSNSRALPLRPRSVGHEPGSEDALQLLNKAKESTGSAPVSRSNSVASNGSVFLSTPASGRSRAGSTSSETSTKSGNRAVRSINAKSLVAFFDSSGDRIGQGVAVVLNSTYLVLVPKHVQSRSNMAVSTGNSSEIVSLVGLPVKDLGNDLVSINVSTITPKFIFCFTGTVDTTKAFKIVTKDKTISGAFEEQSVPVSKESLHKGHSGSPIVQGNRIVGLAMKAVAGSGEFEVTYFDNAGKVSASPALVNSVQIAAANIASTKAQVQNLFSTVFNVTVLIGLAGAPGIHGWLYESSNRFTIGTLAPRVPMRHVRPCEADCLHQSDLVTDKLLQDYAFARLHIFDHTHDTKYGCCSFGAAYYRQEFYPLGLNGTVFLNVLNDLVHFFGDTNWYPNVCNFNKTSQSNEIVSASYGQSVGRPSAFGSLTGCLSGFPFRYVGYSVDVPFYLL